MTEIKAELFRLQDLKYKAFHSKLIPSVSPGAVIGVRTPELRKLAKKLKDSDTAKEFLNELPHEYYEENNLHGFLIEQIKDFNRCVAEIDRFLPYVDNWATCDMMRPKCFKKNPQALLEHIGLWISSSDVYAVRFGIEMLMVFYLDELFSAQYLETAAEVKSEEYYINMMIAWYFATALAKQWDSTIVFLEENKLPVWTHNKTIQKAVESFRITSEQKKYLRTLKR